MSEPEINEELVKEIVRLHCEGCDFYDSRDGCMEPELSERAYCIPRAKKAIARILSAVRDGKLDEALGVVGRMSRDRFTGEWIGNMVHKGAMCFIALRPEKEEK